jgi:hypothetical protein
VRPIRALRAEPCDPDRADRACAFFEREQCSRRVAESQHYCPKMVPWWRINGSGRTRQLLDEKA